MQLFKELSWYFIIEWKRYLGAITLLIIISIFQLFPPKLLGMLIDLIINKQIYPKKILPWIGTIFITAIIVYILRYIWRILLFGAAYNLAIKLRLKLYSYLSKKKKFFYLKYRTGDLIARATNDIEKIVFAAGEGVLTLVDSLVMGCSVLMVMLTQINAKLTILSLLPIPIIAIIIKKYGKQLHYYFYKSQKSFSKLNDQTQESLTSIRMIKSFRLEKQESIKFSKIVKKNGKKNMNVAKIDAKFDPTIHLAISFSNLIAIIEGGNLVSKQEITIGQLTSFIMYLSLMIWPILALAWMFNIVKRGITAWNRINSIFKKNKKKIKKIKINEKYKKIIINIKKFYYPKEKKYTLKNINIKIYPKKTLGICGPTGSGKSTILYLIQKQFKIKKGEIKFNKIPISRIKTKQWRKYLSVVDQTPFLFSDTIKKNITLGKPNASDKKIKYISCLVELHKEIINFPKGYNTKIGEKGVMLSSGQKQKIAIARALLINAKILILDNAFSSLDIKTENKILKNLNLWNKNNTKIIISNRISSLIHCNEIIAIKKGKIIERGKHKKLIKNKNWYNNIYNYQKFVNKKNNKKKIGKKNG
ncbi:ABC transporter transmembrane domain-containing protein [Buchnera aphidicola]|uniref:ABC transporter transmembrane domain-containing protein n=1 Tax=Buchnera aphidicola TaxID=9 RepID=UPI0031B81B35